MELQYDYPGYTAGFTKGQATECAEIGIRLLKDVGMVVGSEKFLAGIKGKSGVTIDGNRVKFDTEFTRRNMEAYLTKVRTFLTTPKAPPAWTLRADGFSLMVLDPMTDEIRRSTCQDLRDMLLLMDSYGVGGDFPVWPQDIPPNLQNVAIHKICWEMSDKVKPYDFQNIEQTRYIYEMCKVLGKPLAMPLNITNTMTLSYEDLNMFVEFYPEWKKGANITLRMINYPMLGINKPVTPTGCAALYVAESMGTYNLFKAYDPGLEVPIGFQSGHPTDLRDACWAFGHPRKHLYQFLNAQLLYQLAGVEMKEYHRQQVQLETSSCANDEQAAMEKMATALTAALQGTRYFGYAGTLAVDDLYSGVQLVIDVEIFNYIKDLIESFKPHPDCFSMDGIYDTIKDVAQGKDEFIGHPDTARKFRNLLPSSNMLRHERLRQWMAHRETLKDRARAECLRRIKEHKQTFHLPDDKQKALDEIYRRAQKEFLS